MVAADGSLARDMMISDAIQRPRRRAVKIVARPTALVRRLPEPRCSERPNEGYAMQRPRPRSSHARLAVLTVLAAATTLAAIAPASRGADKPASATSAASAALSKTGTRYPADADMQGVLDALAALDPKPIETLEPSEARRQPTAADAVIAVLKQQGKETAPSMLVPGVTSTDQTLPGPAGQLPVRIYTPAGAGPFPMVVYFHGGGWVLADKNVYDG